MRICISTPGYPYKCWSVYPFVEQLCNALADRGHEIVVIAPQSVTRQIVRHTPKMPFYRVQYESTGRVVVYSPRYVSFSNLPLFGNRLNAWLITRAIRYAFRMLDVVPDVYYGHFWHSAYFLYKALGSLASPLFVATGESEIALPRLVDRKSLSVFVSNVRGVICVSTKNLKESVAAGLIKEKSCRVIPNAVNPERFFLKDKAMARKNLGIATDDFIVAFLGAFSHRKGSLRLASALTSLGDRHVRAIFIGRDYEPDCRPVYAATVFCGSLPHAEVCEYLCAADVFVLPTLQEGCCNAIVEAMACGLPIISSDRDFNKDILSDDNAILIDPMNIREIAHAITIVRDDVARRNAMAQASLERVKSLTIEKRAAAIEAFIEEML